MARHGSGGKPAKSSYQRQASEAPCTYRCVLTRVGRMWNIANGMKQPGTTPCVMLARPRSCPHARTHSHSGPDPPRDPYTDLDLLDCACKRIITSGDKTSRIIGRTFLKRPTLGETEVSCCRVDIRLRLGLRLFLGRLVQVCFRFMGNVGEQKMRDHFHSWEWRYVELLHFCFFRNIAGCKKWDLRDYEILTGSLKLGRYTIFKERI